MTRVEVLHEAQAEFQEAADYYDAQVPGLGSEFINEVERTLNWIMRQPQAPPVIRDGFRRVMVHRFPFNVIYTVESNRVLIVAIAHQRRRPDYWTDRA